MLLAPYYREYDLPWDGDLESSQRFRKILRVLLIILLILGILFPLLPRPARITVLSLVPDGPPIQFCWFGVEYRVTCSSGPERIETGWWRGADVCRDYYVVTTQLGTRYWLFRSRDDGYWYLHGCFD